MPRGRTKKTTGGYQFVRTAPNGTIYCGHEDCGADTTFRTPRNVVRHALSSHLKTPENSIWCHRCNFNLHEWFATTGKSAFEDHVKVHVPIPGFKTCASCEAVWYRSEYLLENCHLFVEDEDKNVCPACEDGEEHLEGRTWNRVTHDYDYATAEVKSRVFWPSEELLARISSRRGPPAASQSQPSNQQALNPAGVAPTAASFAHAPAHRQSSADQRRRASVAAIADRYRDLRGEPSTSQRRADSLAKVATRLTRRQTLVYGQSLVG